ncbi:MAG: hypothetical protein MSC31_12020 [Solirubrobacteraceae bacterium MAG38_C4-C5]|nr:hypothetical protein [Candidatus Siliceabacter maunaloa]
MSEPMPETGPRIVGVDASIGEQAQGALRKAGLRATVITVTDDEAGDAVLREALTAGDYDAVNLGAGISGQARRSSPRPPSRPCGSTACSTWSTLERRGRRSFWRAGRTTCCPLSSANLASPDEHHHLVSACPEGLRWNRAACRERWRRCSRV